LRRKVTRYKPKILAVLGLGAYRTAFDEPKAQIGRQEKTIGTTLLWALPNPSGLNAHYQRDQLAALFAELKEASDLLHSGKTF
jgi:TDG/mug DNA glycosylase family protein